MEKSIKGSKCRMENAKTHLQVLGGLFKMLDSFLKFDRDFGLEILVKINFLLNLLRGNPLPKGNRNSAIHIIRGCL